MLAVPFVIFTTNKLGGGAAVATIGLPDPPGIPWLRILFALVFCLAVSLLAILALRHFKQGKSAGQLFAGLQGIGPASAIDIVETRRASPHAHISLIHYRGHAYLVAISPANVTLLDKVKLPDGEGSGI